VRGLRLLAPLNVVLDQLDADVAGAFERALHDLEAAGAIVDRRALPLLDRYAAEAQSGRLLAAEAFAVHRDALREMPGAFDPRVAQRMRAGADVSAADYIDRVRWRDAFVTSFARALDGYDAALWPTVAMVAPPLALLAADDDEYTRANLLVLRNTSIVNAADGCAVTIPIHAVGRAPVGLQAAAPHMGDRELIACALALESVLTKR
jgi:aspartyl-tRNA(Asn)/glutamyl-tRNA(Gln) amidotransferase subunit A